VVKEAFKPQLAHDVAVSKKYPVVPVGAAYVGADPV